MCAYTFIERIEEDVCGQEVLTRQRYALVLWLDEDCENKTE